MEEMMLQQIFGVKNMIKINADIESALGNFNCRSFIEGIYFLDCPFFSDNGMCETDSSIGECPYFILSEQIDDNEDFNECRDCPSKNTDDCYLCQQSQSITFEDKIQFYAELREMDDCYLCQQSAELEEMTD